MRAARQEDELPDVLLTFEHPPVYTRGRRSRPGELPMGEDWYLAQGIDVVETDRGGLVTYHGPGQLVGYPIVRVDDVVGYVRTLENALVRGAGRRGRGRRPVSAARGPPVSPACGSAERKIASIGVHLSRGVSTHGFAVNVENDLQPFSLDRAVRAGRRSDDFVAARDGPDAERHEVLPPARGVRGRAGAGAPAAARLAGPSGDAGASSLIEDGPQLVRPVLHLSPGRADHRPSRGGQALVALTVDLEALAAEVPLAAVGLDDDPLVAPDEVDADRRAAVWEHDELVGVGVGNARAAG